ncbi:class A sortase [Lactococcus garvieae]|uniref:Class A sortase n=1 Tax=Lactococcus garvieae TaxID=1363 RepID=A0AA46TVC7_9LACT|nr:class A sortase [Lactococcus garvieae]UYT10297.1 class A sortase [Lactococcus garvieae]UYT12364.1 class A sortase [Lactococcus garvieae]
MLFLFADNIGQHVIQKDAQAYIETSPETMKKNKESQKVKEEASYDPEEVTSLNTEDIIAAQFSKDALAAVGVISIPNLQINLPIFLGVGYNTMMYGSGTMKPDQVMGQGNYSLASHTIFDMQGSAISDVLFGNLKNAQKGQEVYITDKEKVYLYTIDKIEQRSEEEGELILDHSNKKELTLVTCLGYRAPGRLVIHGNLKSVKDYNNQTDKVFKQPFNQWYK